MDNSKDIVRFEIPEDINREQLFGTLDANIKQVEKATGTSIVMRDDGLFIKGTENLKAANIINRMVENLRVEPEIDARRVNYLIDLEQKGESFSATRIRGSRLGQRLRDRNDTSTPFEGMIWFLASVQREQEKRI